MGIILPAPSPPPGTPSPGNVIPAPCPPPTRLMASSLAPASSVTAMNLVWVLLIYLRGGGGGGQREEGRHQRKGPALSTSPHGKSRVQCSPRLRAVPSSLPRPSPVHPELRRVHPLLPPRPSPVHPELLSRVQQAEVGVQGGTLLQHLNRDEGGHEGESGGGGGHLTGMMGARLWGGRMGGRGEEGVLQSMLKFSHRGEGRGQGGSCRTHCL